MLLNFLFFSLFLLTLLSIGNLFNYYVFKYKNSNLINSNNFISSLFFLGFLLVFSNFFLPIKNYFLITLFLLICLYSIFFSKDILLETILKNIFIIFLISTITFYMKVGYDGGLYHLPHQAIIRENKIIFGLFNLHERFGIISIYGYISSVLWLKNNLLLLSYLQGFFYLFLFIFIKELINDQNYKKKILGFATLIFVPIWIRFVDPSFSLVDMPSAIIFIFCFIKGIDLLESKENLSINIKIFLISSVLLFTLKTLYAIFAFYVCFILLLLIKEKRIYLSNILYASIPSIILIFIWLTKNYINTGCLIFPSVLTCFNTDWSDILLTQHIFSEIEIFGQKYASYFNINFFIEYFTKYSYYFVSILIFFFILILIYKKFKFNKKIINYSIYFLFILNIIIYLQLKPIVGFSLLNSSNLNEEKNLAKNLFFNEVLLILFGIILSTLITYLVFFQKVKKKQNINYNLLFIVVIFCFIFNIYWFLSSPNPRFAIGFFAIIPLTIMFFLSSFLINSNYETKKINLNLIFFVYLSISVFVLIGDKLNVKDIISFPNKKIEKIKVVKRDGFGVKPILNCDENEKINSSNFCWLEKNCYFIEKDARIEYLKFKYKLIKKINIRKNLSCK